MARYGTSVDQVTYLDPHDFYEGLLVVDRAQENWLNGQPFGYGATIWDNVSFADVYYQTKQWWLGIPNAGIPSGRPIPGAYNVWVNDAVEGYNTHDVWNQYYLPTIKDPHISISTTPRGYDLSDFGLSGRPIVFGGWRPTPRFLDTNQDHRFTPIDVGTFVNGVNGQGYSLDEITRFRAAPRWEPRNIFNGDFEHSVPNSTGYYPGWGNHGGDTSSPYSAVITLPQPVAIPSVLVDSNPVIGNYMKLTASNPSVRHNWTYIPLGAESLSFDLKRFIAAASDLLVVESAGRVIAEIPLDSYTDKFSTVRVPLLASGQVAQIAFRLSSTANINSKAEVGIDNIGFVGRVTRT